MAPVVGYWGIRGLVNPIRLLLEYAGEKYEFKSWDTASPSWFEQKFQMGLTFPNLPYLIDGNTKLTQTNAIIRYLARKHGLIGKSEEEVQQHEVLDGVFGDIRMGWGLLCYMPSADFEADKKKYQDEKLSVILKQLEELVSKKEYLVGDKVTYSDFILFEILDQHAKLFPDLLNEFPNVQKFHKKIGGLNGVKEYMASDRNPAKFNGPSARWGG